MGISISWLDDDKTIIRWDIPDGWSPLAFREAGEQAIAMIQSVPHHVDVVTFVSGYNFPTGILPEIKTLLERYPDDTLSVVIESSPFINAGFKSIKPLLHIFSRKRCQFMMVQTLEAALECIYEHRAFMKNEYFSRLA